MRLINHVQQIMETAGTSGSVSIDVNDQISRRGHDWARNSW